MPHVLTYHRPNTIAEALVLLTRDAPPTRLLGGGTLVNADPSAPPTDVVDLQALHLGGITVDHSHAAIGAMTTLQDIADDARLPSVLRDLARRDAPSTLRTLATIGGAVVQRHGESELLAGLLAMDATIDIVDADGARTLPLTDVFTRSVDGRTIVTRVHVRIDGTLAVARTARTPADTPIVAVVARRGTSGVTVAASGIATTPRVVDPSALHSITPPSDFRGSSAYRSHLLRVLTARALAEVART